MSRFIQWLNCPECCSNNIYSHTGGWSCRDCGHQWGFEEDDGKYKIY